jgi:heme A synthase
LHAIIEYSHRAVGSITGVLIIATVVLAWAIFRTQRPLVAWLASASLLGIVGEGVLGGVVVARELSSWIVLFHLGLAMMILGFLVATAVMARPASPGIPDRSFRRIAGIGVAATYVLLLTGSTVVASGADESCHSWPVCGNGFALSFGGVDAFTMLHRGSVLVIGAFLVYVLIKALRQPDLRLVAAATLAVLGLQVAVGAGSALTDGALFNGLHVAIATLVWSGMLTTALLTLPRTDRSPSLARLAMDKRPA